MGRTNSESKALGSHIVQDLKVVFVVGYSRSGTKFMCNLLEKGCEDEFRHFGELHFFGRISTGSNEKIDSVEVLSIISRLLEHYAKRLNYPYREDALPYLIKKAENVDFSYKEEVYAFFLSQIGEDLGANTVCDGTPRNAYYLKEILQIFPRAKIIYMLRDPRDCIYSQKMKSSLLLKRGDESEARRLKSNYNPLIMSRFWGASLRCLERHRSNSRVLMVKYETLLADPVGALEEVSAFLDIGDVSHLAHLVQRNNSHKWKNGLSSLEVAACEFGSSRGMAENSYVFSSGMFLRVTAFVYYSFKAVILAPIVYLRNLGRFKSAFHEFRRRI